MVNQYIDISKKIYDIYTSPALDLLRLSPNLTGFNPMVIAISLVLWEIQAREASTIMSLKVMCP